MRTNVFVSEARNKDLLHLDVALDWHPDAHWRVGGTCDTSTSAPTSTPLRLRRAWSGVRARYTFFGTSAMKQVLPSRRTPLAVAVGTALSLAATQALAAEQAGRVLAASGSVVASAPRSSAQPDPRLAGSMPSASRRSADASRSGSWTARWCCSRPNTRFQVERYEYREAEPEEPEDEGGGSVLMRLFQGAMRTITGAIDTGRNDDYSVETPVATIGLRGTQYDLQYCEAGDCPGAEQGLG
ncbi:MAG: hypothetical protein U5K43_05970 [Halofilum sp. (in: g-proteobacteria)]|nr:hypothetical protein [Halofilum sp. (in: g-proteobacteria)]